jgi:hypothetical protein
MATNNKPVNTLRCGNIKATIWQMSARRVRSSQRPFSAVQGSIWRVAQWNLGRSQGPRSAYHRRV